jgi:hypothetical protein
VGPGSYITSSPRDWQKSHRASFSFGLEKRENEAKYISRDHLEVEAKMKATPASSRYQPSTILIKES